MYPKRVDNLDLGNYRPIAMTEAILACLCWKSQRPYPEVHRGCKIAGGDASWLQAGPLHLAPNPRLTVTS